MKSTLFQMLHNDSNDLTLRNKLFFFYVCDKLKPSLNDFTI